MIGLTVWIGAFLVVATCSSDGTEPDEGQARQTAEDPNSTVEPLRVATLNVLHGLSCPPENDFCQAADRAQLVAEGLEKADCPDLVGFQEIGPRQGQLIPEAMSTEFAAAAISWHGRWVLAPSAVRTWRVPTARWCSRRCRSSSGATSTSPSSHGRPIGCESIPLSGRSTSSRRISRAVRTTRRVSRRSALRSAPVGLETNQCNAREVVELFEFATGHEAADRVG